MKIQTTHLNKSTEQRNPADGRMDFKNGSLIKPSQKSKVKMKQPPVGLPGQMEKINCLRAS